MMSRVMFIIISSVLTMQIFFIILRELRRKRFVSSSNYKL